MRKIKCKVGTFGINYSQKNIKLSLYYYSNLLEFGENYFLLLFQSIGIGINYLSIIIPIFWNWGKIIFYYYLKRLELE
jgi:hypothetical protein